jgi:hypothetical protein
MFEKINSKTLFPLLEIGAKIVIPNDETLENDWGVLEINSIQAQDSVEFRVLGCSVYFPLSEKGTHQGVKWAYERVKEFISEC